MTLYWKRCNTGGIVLGMTVGALSAIGLVLVSPNMTYPNQVRASNQVIVDAGPAKIGAAEALLAAATTEAERVAADKAVANARAAVETAEARIASVEGQTTSLVGLEAPLITLRNPGIISIPLGFLCVFLGSLFYRDPRAFGMWEELHVRSQTGINAEGATAH
jgi:cation/acetate symporter